MNFIVTEGIKKQLAYNALYNSSLRLPMVLAQSMKELYSDSILKASTFILVMITNCCNYK